MESRTEIYLFAKQIALRRLDRRECSSQDVYRHLTKKGVLAEVAVELVSELIKKNFINDERYATLLSREQAVRGKGPHLIRQKLKEKGIHLSIEEIKTLTEQATQTSELEAATAWVRRKFTHLSANTSKNDKEMRRALQALLRRGFSYSVACTALQFTDVPCE